MKWLGYDEMAVEDIAYDAEDIGARMQTSDVAELAADIQDAGEEPIHAPTVRSGSRTRTLVCGRDRLAASLLNGARTLWVHVAECTDQEARKLELRENLRRRNVANRAQQLAALVAMEEQDIIDRDTNVAGGGTAPPMQRVKAEARERVARAAGVTRATVKSAEKRAAKRERHVDEPEVDMVAEMTRASASEALELPLGFETFGVTVAPERRAEILLAIDDLDGWRRVIAGVEEQLRQRLQAPDPVVPHAVTEAIRAKLEGVLVSLATAKPVALCSKCRGARCERCKKTGVVAMGGNAALSALTPPPLKGERKVTVVIEPGESQPGYVGPVRDKEVA